MSSHVSFSNVLESRPKRNVAGAKRFPISTTDPINVTANVIVDHDNGPLLQALASDSDGWCVGTDPPPSRSPAAAPEAGQALPLRGRRALAPPAPTVAALLRISPLHALRGGSGVAGQISSSLGFLPGRGDASDLAPSRAMAAACTIAL